MVSFRVVLPLLSVVCWGVEGPWTETFTIPLAGEERTIVVHGGSTWLLLTPTEASNQTLLLGRKEVVIETKCLRESALNGVQRVSLGSFPTWIAQGPQDLWATSLETDNLYLYGILDTVEGSEPILTVQRVEPAPSDTQIIARHLATIGPRDWPARLKAAEWVRARATNQPNKEFWLASADVLIGQTIDDAATAAAERQDLALLEQAISWSVDLLRDTPRAGRIASAPWTRALPASQADQLGRRLRRLGLELYRELWRPRAEALSLEFEDRFAAIGWKDADAFYRLGRWADTNGDYLPQAKERVYRCYQAGFKADPGHQGIRNELGLPNQVGGDGAQAAANLDFHDRATGVTVPAPLGWKRGERLGGDWSWIDPTSETAYLTLRVLKTPESEIVDSTWRGIISPLQAREGYEVVGQEDLLFASGAARRLSYRFREGRYTRHADVLMAVNTTARVAVQLDATYAEEEAENVRRLVMIAFGVLTIPDHAPAPDEGH